MNEILAVCWEAESLGLTLGVQILVQDLLLAQHEFTCPNFGFLCPTRGPPQGPLMQTVCFGGETGTTDHLTFWYNLVSKI